MEAAMKSSCYKIRERGGSWQVDFGEIRGKRIRKQFETRHKAEVWARNKQRQLKREGERAFALTADDVQEHVNAKSVLPEHVTLEDAARFYMDHTAPEGREITVNGLLAEYLEAKTKAGLTPTSVKSIRDRMRPFAEKFGEELVARITVQDIERWLDQGGKRGPYRGRNRASYIRHFTGFYNYAIRKGYAKESPAVRVERVRVDEVIPEILSVEDFERLLRRAEQHGPEMLPYFCLGAFAGLRPKETRELNWRDIHLDQAKIVIIPRMAR